MYVYTHTLMKKNTHKCIYVYIYLFVYIHIYMYIYAHTLTHTRVSILIQIKIYLINTFSNSGNSLTHFATWEQRSRIHARKSRAAPLIPMDSEDEVSKSQSVFILTGAEVPQCAENHAAMSCFTTVMLS